MKGKCVIFLFHTVAVILLAALQDCSVAPFGMKWPLLLMYVIYAGRTDGSGVLGRTALPVAICAGVFMESMARLPALSAVSFYAAVALFAHVSRQISFAIVAVLAAVLCEMWLSAWNASVGDVPRMLRFFTAFLTGGILGLIFEPIAVWCARHAGVPDDAEEKHAGGVA